MATSSYKQARTLVRRLCRLPGEDKAHFKQKIARLRTHFERFNIDVADICQWLMGLRPKETADDRGVTVFWEFFLDPAMGATEVEEALRDRWRLAVFDDVAGFHDLNEIAGEPLPHTLRGAMHQAAMRPKTPNALSLFTRLRGLDPSHRLVLLKAAAEWIVSRYQRVIQNWECQRAQWEQEKCEWEKLHPQLTEHARNAFTSIFKSLSDPDRNGRTGVRRKNPRICCYERLAQHKHNCVYAGEKGHSPLCWKYSDFLREQKGRDSKFNAKHFATNAAKYVDELLRLKKKPSNRKVTIHQAALERLYKQVPQCQRWFKDSWKAYLHALNLSEDTILNYRRLPHCLKIGETWEKSKCEWNRHTELCLHYKDAVAALPLETLKLEPAYREWRRDYLEGPRKPSFRYPSSRDLPMPKIFGSAFHEIDFARSVLRLRLDDMPQGEWMEFGFTAWPLGYRPGKDEVNVKSVHVNFVGSRARAGFRFDVAHRKSRFRCSQDEIDESRSRQFPRRAQDHQFLNAARKRLLESFSGVAEEEMRALAVDLGETGASGSIYQGRAHLRDSALRIVKIDACYPGVPDILDFDQERIPPVQFQKEIDWRGLRKEHVAHHLAQIQQGASRIAEVRATNGLTAAALRKSDFRGLTRHIRWMIRDWVRHNAAQIVALAEQEHCDLIIFESLRGFRPRGYDVMDSAQKRRLAFFAYGAVRRNVVEKAVERGMRVVTVPYGYSSKMCSGCGHKQQDEGRWRRMKGQRRFECECGDPPRRGRPTASAIDPRSEGRCRCRLKLDSDANAARVLARVFWGEIELPAFERTPQAS